MNNEDIRPVLFIYCENAEMKKKITDAMSSKVKTCIIDAEYIRDPEDPEDATRYELYKNATGQQKIDRRNSSINRAYSNKTYKLYIVTLGTISKDLGEQHATHAKLSGDCRPMGMFIDSFTTQTDKCVVVLESKEFDILAKLFETSTPGTKVVPSKNSLYVDLAEAITSKSPLIVLNCPTTSVDYVPCIAITHGTSRSEGNGYGVVNITTAPANVTNPIVKIKGRPLPNIIEQKNVDASNLQPTEETPRAPDSTTNRLKDWFKDFPKGSFWKAKMDAFRAWW